MKNSNSPGAARKISVKAPDPRVITVKPKAVDKIPTKVTSKRVSKPASKRLLVGKTVPHRAKANSAKPALGYSPTGEEIKAAVLAAGLTQDAAAALIYSTRRTLQDWEANVSWMHPGLWELLKMKLANLSAQ